MGLDSQSYLPMSPAYASLRDRVASAWLQKMRIPLHRSISVGVGINMHEHYTYPLQADLPGLMVRFTRAR